MTTLRINITKEVLEATKDCRDNHPANCAISYAIREVWPKAITLGDEIVFFDKKRSPRIYHGQDVWIEQFDLATPADRAAMQPFSFVIEVPDEVINEINIDEIRRICEGSKTLELVKL